jgi:hypothetical protein
VLGFQITGEDIGGSLIKRQAGTVALDAYNNFRLLESCAGPYLQEAGLAQISRAESHATGIY